METLRILYGTTFDKTQKDGEEYYKNVSRVFTMLLNQSGMYQVEKFDFAFSKTRVMEHIESGNFNVIITDGTISSVNEDSQLVRDGIGFSTIKSWLTEKPEMKVIVIEEQASKGKAKIGRLFKELCFYNIVFKPEPENFTWKALITEIVNVLTNGRTAAQALKEYGIEGYDDIKAYLAENPWVLEGGERPTVEAVSSNNSSDNNNEEVNVVAGVSDSVEEVKEDIFSASEKANESAVHEGTEEDMSLEEIEAMFAQSEEKFKHFSDADAGVGFEKEPEPAREEPVVEEKENKTFAFGDFAFDMPSNDEVKKEEEKTVIFESNPDEDLKVSEGPVEEKADKFVFEFANAEPMQGGASTIIEEAPYREVERTREVMTFNRSSSSNGIMPARGIIKGVVDYDTILVEFDNAIEMIETLDEYRCIVKVRSGKKGMVIDGRYKSANISFDAYLEAVVDERTVMMEVPEFDCEEKRDYLDGKECNFVFVKM